MKKSSGFYDLRVSGKLWNQLNETFEKHIKFGYRTVAVETVIQEEAFQSTGAEKDKSMQSKEKTIVPIPIDTSKFSNRFQDKLTILHRLTVHFSDGEQLSRLFKEPHMNKYDLLAVVPSSELAFRVACSHPKVDIITFNHDSPMTHISRKHYYVAVERGICFELSYAQAILDRNSRRNIIVQAHQYHVAGKSRNIVLTSGVKNASELRGPYDVVNLGLLFGMSEEQCKAALTYTCQKLLIESEARRSGRPIELVKKSDPRLSDPAHNDGRPKKRVKTEAN